MNVYGEGQESLACCNSWGHRFGHDWVTEQKKWTYIWKSLIKSYFKKSVRDNQQSQSADQQNNNQQDNQQNQISKINIQNSCFYASETSNSKMKWRVQLHLQ